MPFSNGDKPYFPWRKFLYKQLSLLGLLQWRKFLLYIIFKGEGLLLQIDVICVRRVERLQIICCCIVVAPESYGLSFCVYLECMGHFKFLIGYLICWHFGQGGLQNFRVVVVGRPIIVEGEGLLLQIDVICVKRMERLQIIY